MNRQEQGTNGTEQLSYCYVDNASAVEELLLQMAGAERIAFDIEADSLHHYYEKVCLMQLTVHSKNYIIDPLSQVDLTEFFETLSRKTLIFHDGGYDLRMLDRSFGFRPEKEIFDTMAAAQLLGYERFGLVAMIKECFGIELSKKGQKSNWARRPLSTNQLQYAASDTYYLEKMSAVLIGRLKEFNRDSWHAESCQRVMEAAYSKTVESDPDKVWRIKGIGRFDPLRLTLVREIWRWREREAKKSDLPPFKIITNEAIHRLVDFSAANPKSPLKEGPRLPRNFRGSKVRSLDKIIRRVHEMPETDLAKQPERKGRKVSDPEGEHIFKALRAECKVIAAELELPLQIIASNAILTAITKARAVTVEQIVEHTSAMGWQVKLIQPATERVMGEFGE